MAMPLEALSDHTSLQDLQGREQSRCPIPFVVMRHGAAAALLNRQTGWVRSSAWIWLFSSTHRTIACWGGFRYRPTTSVNFSKNLASRDSLNVFTRCGLML